MQFSHASLCAIIMNAFWFCWTNRFNFFLHEFDEWKGRNLTSYCFWLFCLKALEISKKIYSQIETIIILKIRSQGFEYPKISRMAKYLFLQKKIKHLPNSWKISISFSYNFPPIVQNCIKNSAIQLFQQ